MSEKAKHSKQKTETKLENKEEISQNEETEQRSYYYDDAHGYEVYQPDEDEEGDEEQGTRDESRERKTS